MLFVGTSIIHPSTEGVFLLCNILDLLIYSFDVNVFDILKKFEVKEVEINYCYSKTGKYKRKYKEKISIDFEEYRGILDYISELDEFKNSVDKLNKSMIRFIDISKIDDSVEQRIKEQGADSQQ